MASVYSSAQKENISGHDDYIIQGKGTLEVTLGLVGNSFELMFEV